MSKTWFITGTSSGLGRMMLGSVNRSPAPKRLTLGSGAYASIHAALTERLAAALEAQKDIALSADI